MIALTREEKNHIANKKYATYAKKKVMILMMMRNIVRFENTIIKQVSIEVQQIICAIKDTKLQKEFLCCDVMDQIMIVISS